MASSDRGRGWTKEETSDLISLWGEETIQSQLDSARHNHKVFERLAEALSEKGHSFRSGRQCSDKIKKLKKKYRDILDHNNRSGRNLKTWEYFDQMDQILGSKPTSRPKVLIQSINTVSSDDDLEQHENPASHSSIIGLEEDMSDVEDDENSPSQNLSGSDSQEKSDVEGEDGERPLKSTATGTPVNSTPKRLTTHQKSRVIKKKKSKIEKAIDLATENFTSTMKEMDERFFDLECKRQKKEQETRDKLIELEEKRIEADRLRIQAEERNRQAERDHEQRMFAMMLQAIQSSQQTTINHQNPQPYSQEYPNTSFYNMDQY